MRTLSKLQHERFKDPGRSEDLRRAEKQIVHSQERGVWRKRLVWGRRLGLLGALAYVVTAFGLAWGRTADGQVVAEIVDAVAPNTVRVVAVHCRAGDAVAVGDPIVTIEPVEDPRRAVLVADLEAAARRLALVEAGGSLGTTDPDRRRERLLDAERELRRADLEWQQARVTARGLERTRDLTATVLRQDRARLSGAAAVLAERVAEAESDLRRAATLARDAERDADARGQLAPRGVVSGITVDEALARRDAARAELAARDAALDGLRRAHTAASREHLLDAERAAAALDELETRVAGAWLRADRLGEEADVWRATVAEFRAALPETMADARDLWRMEVALAEAERDRAAAALAAHDQEVGRTVVRAARAGLVGRLPVTPGAIVPTGGLLASCYDPALHVVEAYVGDDLARRIAARLESAESGSVVECLIAGESGGVEMRGVVLSVDSSLRRLPDDLSTEEGLRPDLFRVVRIRPVDPTQLSACMRVVVVFEADSAPPRTSPPTERAVREVGA